MRYHELIESSMVRTPRDDFQTDLTSHNSILENPAFHKWFGKSKVVDSTGLPLVCYHGTFQEFTEFKHKSERVKSHGFDNLGFWFDVHAETAFDSNQIKSIWGSEFTNSPHVHEKYVSSKLPVD